MGASTTGVEAHSHYFTPFYVQRGANGIPSSGTYLLTNFEVGSIHYFEATYLMYYDESSPSCYLFKTLFTYNDDGVLSTQDLNQNTEYLAVNGDTNILSSGFANNLFSFTSPSGISIYIALLVDGVTAQGIYQYI